ncbi:MAG: hypothetical protein WCI45_00880 [Desulfuromonadales bacterium]
MAKTAEMKIPDDIEYRVIGNAFGLLIASAGLLAGEMVRERSFEYWLNDTVPLLFALWMVYRLYRNFLLTMNAYPGVTPSDAVLRDRQIRETLKSEQVAVAQISSKTGYTAEQVVQEVAKRIESQKAAAQKKSNQ